MVGINLPTPKAPTSPIAGLGKAISTGMEYGARMREYELKKDEHAQRKQQYEQQKQSADIKMVEKEAAVFAKFPKMSKKSRDISIKKLNEVREIRGIKPFDEILTTEMLSGNPELSQKASIAYNAILKGDPSPEQVSDFLAAEGEEAYETAYIQAGKIEAAKEKAMVEFGGRKALEEYKLTKKLEMEKLKMGEARSVADKKRIDSYRVEVKKSMDKYEFWNVAEGQIGAIEERFKKTGRVAPQDRVTLVRQFSALTEARKSVVREGEFKVIAGATSLWNRAKSTVKGLVSGEPIPIEVASDIIKSYRLYKPAMDKIRKRALTPIWGAMKRFKIDYAQDSIFGEYSDIFKKGKAEKKKEPLRQKQLKKKVVPKSYSLPSGITAEQKAKISRYEAYAERNNIKITQKKINRLLGR